jgi:hypothetical protein
VTTNTDQLMRGNSRLAADRNTRLTSIPVCDGLSSLAFQSSRQRHQRQLQRSGGDRDPERISCRRDLPTCGTLCAFSILESCVATIENAVMHGLADD